MQLPETATTLEWFGMSLLACNLETCSDSLTNFTIIFRSNNISTQGQRIVYIS